MIIEEQDFRLTPSSNTASNFWDLELLVTIRVKGTKIETRQEFKNVGYGLTLESAIRRICNYRIQHRHSGQAVTLAQYIKEYGEEVDKIDAMCKALKKSTDKN